MNKSLLPTGKAAVSIKTRKRGPDQSYVPRRRRHGKASSKWPSFVTEVGYSQSKAKVDYDAHRWLNESKGDVVTISFQPRRRAMTIEKWSLVDRPTRTDEELSQGEKFNRQHIDSSFHSRRQRNQFKSHTANSWYFQARIFSIRRISQTVNRMYRSL